jgi:hypothetical protein
MFKRKEKKKSWEDIKLYQNVEIANLPPFEDELDKMINIMAVVLDITIEEVEAKTPDELLKFFEDYKFMNEMPGPKLQKIIELDGKKYGMIDLSKMNMAQLTDIEEFYKQGLENNIQNILAVLFLPIKKYNVITKKYTLEEYSFSNDRADLFFNHADMEFVFGNLNLFFESVQIYSKSLANYLHARMITK